MKAVIEYPKYMYHKTKDAVIVKDELEVEALGKEWVNKPFHKAKLVEASPKHLDVRPDTTDTIEEMKELNKTIKELSNNIDELEKTNIELVETVKTASEEIESLEAENLVLVEEIKVLKTVDKDETTVGETKETTAKKTTKKAKKVKEGEKVFK